MENYRCYTFNNFYLSSIQQGIQAAHSQTSLMLKCMETDRTPGTSYAVKEWAKNPVTICLNGGNNQDMLDLERLLMDERQIPWCSFREDEQSLGRLLTSISIVLPERVYSVLVDCIKTSASFIKDKEDGLYIFSEKLRVREIDMKIAEKISMCGLAR